MIVVEVGKRKVKESMVRIFLSGEGELYDSFK